MSPSSSRTIQTVVLALLVIGLIALALGGYLTPLSRYILTPLVTAQTWLATRYQAVQTYISSPQDISRLRQSNTDLQAQVSQLQSEIINLKQQIAETRVLSALVDFARANPDNQYVGAAVIGRDTSPFLQYVIINQGSDNGIRRGMPVVNNQGLVGRITAVTASAARVQLITDNASTVNVRLDPSTAQGILQGQMTGEVLVNMIPQSATVQIGDLVLTSGLGGTYPPSILIGQVTGVRKRDYDIFQSASIQPAVDFTQLEIVLVITNFHPVDIGPLVPTPVTP